MRQYSPLIAGAALAAAVTLAGPARALTFSNDFTDPSWSQSSTILNEMETAVPAAEHVLDGLSDGIEPNAGDLTGVMEHEITHALGRVDYAFVDPNPTFLTPLNLARYGCGTTSLTTLVANACLSLDGGATDLNQFDPTGSDTGDWLTPSHAPTGDAFNAFFYYGQLLTMSPADILEMSALEWDPFSSSVPESAAWALLGLGFVGLGLVRSARRSGPRTASI